MDNKYQKIFQPFGRQTGSNLGFSPRKAWGEPSQQPTLEATDTGGDPPGSKLGSLPAGQPRAALHRRCLVCSGTASPRGIERKTSRCNWVELEGVDGGWQIGAASTPRVGFLKDFRRESSCTQLNVEPSKKKAARPTPTEVHV